MQLPSSYCAPATAGYVALPRPRGTATISSVYPSTEPGQLQGEATPRVGWRMEREDRRPLWNSPIAEVFHGLSRIEGSLCAAF
jgi:hypothetical protein